MNTTPSHPTVHLNGTSADDLLSQIEEAAMALRLAIAALSDARPNARDYYPQGDGAFREANASHADRMAKLQSVLDELGAVHERIQEQADARPRRK